MEKCPREWPRVPLRLKLSDFLIYKTVDVITSIFRFLKKIFWYNLETGAALSGAVWKRGASCFSAN